MIDNIIEIDDYFILVNNNENKVPFLSGTLHLGFSKTDFNDKVMMQVISKTKRVKCINNIDNIVHKYMNTTLKKNLNSEYIFKPLKIIDKPKYFFLIFEIDKNIDKITSLTNYI